MTNDETRLASSFEHSTLVIDSSFGFRHSSFAKQAPAQCRIPSRRILPLHRQGQRLAAADENYQLLAACDARVQQVALEHQEVLRVQWDHHGRVFAALAAVDRNGIGERQLVELAEFVDDPAERAVPSGEVSETGHWMPLPPRSLS